jgi:hypothetical protein
MNDAPATSPNIDVRQPRGAMPLLGLLVTVAVHAVVFGAMWLARAHASKDTGPILGNFVDAQLVKFGKPRDMKFLPHKEGSTKKTVENAEIKLARDANAPINEKKDEKADVDPLKKTHTEMFKQAMDDDRPPAIEQTGSLTGSKAGTATEAKGDPYILALIDKIGSAWTVPTTLRDDQLRTLSADVCLTIDANGNLTEWKWLKKSDNSQFDSSLEASLGQIKILPPPPDRFRAAAARGRLCPNLSKIP